MIKLTDTKADHVLGVRIEEKLTAKDVETAMNFVTQEDSDERKHVAVRRNR